MHASVKLHATKVTKVLNHWFTQLHIFSTEAVARMSSLKGCFRNFAKFTGKNLCRSLFFNKVPGLRPPTLLKKRLWHWFFPVNFMKFLRTPFLTEHLWWLLLSASAFQY